MFAYRMSFLQPLLPADYPLRLDYAQTNLRKLVNDSGFLERIVFCNECVMNTKVVFNKSCARVWSLENFRVVIKRSITSEKVMS